MSYDRKVKLVFVRVATILAAAIGQYAQKLGVVFLEQRQHPIIEQTCGRDRCLAVVELGAKASFKASPQNPPAAREIPRQFEARARRWLDEIITGSVSDAQHLARRERCTVRQIHLTLSLAFLAPKLMKAAAEGRLPRGINIERLRNSHPEWGRQFEELGLDPD
jgi:hypothetical protein